jgi:hypothetical protein
MTRGDTSKLANGPGQAIRRLPTGRYELSANLQRPQRNHQDRQPPRLGGGLYRRFALFDEKEAGWKVDRSVLALSVVALMGISGLAVLSIKMVGTVPELETQSAAAVSPAEAKRPENNHASIEVLGRGATGDSVAPTKVAKSTLTLPPEWLIENLTAAARDPRLRKQAPTSPPSSPAAAVARAEVPVGSGSPDDAERGPREAAGSTGKPPGLGLGAPPTSELQSPPISSMRTDKRRFEAHHTARRGTMKSARRKGGHGSSWNRFFHPWASW